MKTSVFVGVSVDGFIAPPDGTFEATTSVPSWTCGSTFTRSPDSGRSTRP